MLNFKVLYANGDGIGLGSSLPPVNSPVEGPSDRDILDGDDDAISEEIPSDRDGKRKSKGQIPAEEEVEQEEDETEDEDEESDDEESDGTGDEDLDDEEKVLTSSDLSKKIKKLAPDLFKKVPGLREALELSLIHI